ncbi:hypothetical protein [Jatrophihabitans sp.]|jgi:hypothetical protein|uniref:hypothetical protein n=1 Tax=Jatrophihabitans sp. TaxID=1932789 RepID=UPI002F190903
MKLGARSRIVIGAAVLAAGTLLGPSAPASATYPICQPDTCDMLIEYYSDATFTVRVGEYEDGPCGYVNWGEMTQYSKSFRRYC